MILAAGNYAWYVARAGGLLAFVLLTASVVAGLLLSGKARLEGWPRFALEDVHRFLGLLAGSFILLHGGALLVDSYLPFSLGNLLIPGTAPYRPLEVAAGVVAVTNHYRKALPRRFWRRAHYLNFAVWLLALVHGITAGTDTGSAWAIALYLAAAAAVGGLTAAKIVPAPPRARGTAVR